MYHWQGKSFESAGAALDGYVREWERCHGSIQTPGFSVRDQRGLRRAVFTIWTSLWAQDTGDALKSDSSLVEEGQTYPSHGVNETSIR